MKTGIKVYDAMTNKPITLSPDTAVSVCAKTMNEKHVGSIVVAEGNELLGLITEQDIVRKVMAGGLDSDSTPLKAIMVKEMFTVSPEKDVGEAIVMMKEKNIRHLPVVDGKKIVGYITSKDILKLQPHLFETLAEVIELKEEERKVRVIEKIRI